MLAEHLDRVVWQDLCSVLQQPTLIQDALRRAQSDAWLPQARQARQDTLRKARANLQQQITRLTDAYLREVIPLDEYERRRYDLEGKDRGLGEQLQQVVAEAARYRDVAGLATSIEAFCERVQRSLAMATFEQRRELVELLIDRVIATDGDVEIRYGVPLSWASEQVHFSHLRKDYFDDYADVPGAAFARFHIRWMAGRGVEARVGQDDHLIYKVGDQGRDGRGMDMRWRTVPRNNQPELNNEIA